MVTFPPALTRTQSCCFPEGILGGRPLRRAFRSGLALLLGMVACNRQPSGESARPSGSVTVSSSAAAPSAAPQNPFQGVKPTQLLALPSSAYTASVVLDDDAIYVLTANAAHRVVPGLPPQAYPLDLNYGWTATRLFFVFWSKGGIWKASKRDGKPTRLAKLEHQPQFFVSSGDEFAWIRKLDDDHFRIQTLEGGKPRTLYESSGSIDAAAMLNDWVFFVERQGPTGWRIGGIWTGGGQPNFSGPKTGRAPSMLSAWRDIYYYDGNPRDIVRISPDLRREETLARDFICSPILAWEHVYCANVEGLSVLFADSHSPVRILDHAQGTITTLAANQKRLIWLSDAGPDKLALAMIELPRVPTH